jgi:RNA polymerase sigma factor (sigma-70 family)
MHALKINESDRKLLDDTTIVRRILAGEKELFELLLRRYNQKLYRVIRSYLRDADDIDDAMQETYLKAFRKLDQFRSESAFSTWLTKIGINEALYRLKKRANNRTIQLESADVDDPKIIQLPDMKASNPEKIAIGNETKKIIEHAIDSLPEKYRIAYVLKEVEGMTTNEICDTLQINETNLKVRIHRAKTMMKENLLRISADSAIFEFGNSRCDAIVTKVMSRIMEA